MPHAVMLIMQRPHRLYAADSHDVWAVTYVVPVYDCTLLSAAFVLLQASERHKSSGISLGITGPVPLPPGITDEDDKYVRRAHPLKRTLQRLFPGLFAPGLPVTARWVDGLHRTGQLPACPGPSVPMVEPDGL